jgi:hypothetical protein
MFKIKKYVMFIFMELQYLSPHEPMVGWLKICHIVVEARVQISFLIFDECD